jgi:cytochrome c553
MIKIFLGMCIVIAGSLYFVHAPDGKSYLEKTPALIDQGKQYVKDSIESYKSAMHKHDTDIKSNL